MPPSNGGTAQRLKLALYPQSTASGNALYKFDVTNFADMNNGGVYSWKKEDVICGRTPTINRVIVSCRDLGTTQVQLMLTGTNDSQQVVSSPPIFIVLGTVAATGQIITYSVIGLSFSAQNLQLNLTRLPGAGPVSITKVRMEGRVETTPYG
jgi:hypothetical protein